MEREMRPRATQCLVARKGSGGNQPGIQPSRPGISMIWGDAKGNGANTEEEPEEVLAGRKG